MDDKSPRRYWFDQGRLPILPSLAANDRELLLVLSAKTLNDLAGYLCVIE
jgi:hypothetical protein